MKLLGYFAIGLLCGVVLMFGFHMAMAKRERTYQAIYETAQQTMEARLLAQKRYAELDSLMELHLLNRVRFATEKKLPSKNRVIGFAEVYYEFTDKTPPEEIAALIEGNDFQASLEDLDSVVDQAVDHAAGKKAGESAPVSIPE